MVPLCLFSLSLLTHVASYCTDEDARIAATQAERNPDRWMRTLQAVTCANFSEKRLIDVTLLGSHDSGSWWLGDRAANCGVRCMACGELPETTKRWGLAQNGSITQQLQSGVRFFDFRLTVDPDVAGCDSQMSVSGECWKVWHCFYGSSAPVAFTELRDFLKADMDESRGHEVVIVKLKLEYFDAFDYGVAYDNTKTSARIDSLLQLFEAQLGEFIFDEASDWWSLPLRRITASGKRLIVLLQARSDRYQLHSNTSRFRPDGECSLDDPTCGGAIWGKYSDTCCQTKVLAADQRKKQQTYASFFLKGSSREEALRAGARPLLKLYWTMTYSPLSWLTGDNGQSLTSLKDAANQANAQLAAFFNCSGDLPIFANIIMADWIGSSSSALRVASISSLVGPHTTHCFNSAEIGPNATQIAKQPLIM